MAGRTEREIKNSEKNVLSLNSEQVLNLKQVTEEYKIKPDNPELLTKFMRSFWQETGRRIEKNCIVSEFPLSSEEIKKRGENGQMAIFVPAEVTRIDLGKMFPKMTAWPVKKGNLNYDMVDSSGWLWVEASIDAPNRNATQEQLEKIFKREKKQGQSLRTYIIGGQISKLLTNEYFDEGPTRSRIPSTINEYASELVACFRPNGDLHTGPWTSWYLKPYDEDMGGRSEEMIKA
jgi:hypothetical protein